LDTPSHCSFVPIPCLLMSGHRCQHLLCHQSS